MTRSLFLFPKWYTAPLIAALLTAGAFSAQAQDYLFARPDGSSAQGQQPAHSAQQQAGGNNKVSVQSGTGFFITNTGYLLTNEHVVRGCENVTLRGTVKPTPAAVIGVDPEMDLALLKTDMRPARVAPLRDTEATVYLNDPVMVIGYPLDRGVSGVYKVAKSQVIGLKGPQDEPKWIQFASSALQGNSGGPLLDASGSVIGVIAGKTKLFKVNSATGQKGEIIQESDVAVSLPVVKEFLHKHQVYFQTQFSKSYYSIDRVENMAKQYIVNIHCRAGGE